jgi:oligopeptide/dipeptide ABC transporter ATP-binding protein
MRTIRGSKVSMIFQDPMTSLNPVLTIGRQLALVMRAHQPDMSKAAARARAIELLERVAISQPARRVDAYPHELSGGMRQRVMIAMAIANNPQVLIADEPTTALDVTVQAQIMELLDELRRESGLALVLITHDLGVVAGSADRVAVMYAGRIVETGAVGPLFAAPSHPYTRGLLDCLPRLDVRHDVQVSIPGLPVSPLNLPPGCPFAPRCSHALPACTEVEPVLTPHGDTLAACDVVVASGVVR